MPDLFSNYAHRPILIAHADRMHRRNVYNASGSAASCQVYSVDDARCMSEDEAAAGAPLLVRRDAMREREGERENGTSSRTGRRFGDRRSSRENLR